MAFGNLLRPLTVALLFVALALAGVTVGVVLEGERALGASDKAFDQGKVEEALVYAQRAATLYAPGAPHRAAAYERMVAVALGSERKGDTALSLRAWQAVRGAALETRHLWQVEQRWLLLANENLARLQAGVASGNAAVADRKAVSQEALALLSKDEGPRVVWIVVLGVGFFLTVLGLGWGVATGVTQEGLLIAQRWRWPLVSLVTGLVCWMVAVFRA